MPWAPKRHRPPGQQTEQQRKAQLQKTRGDQDRQRFYRSAAWKRKRLQILNARPLCEECLKQGRTTAATVVDHDLDLRDHPELALADANLRPSCKSCHDSKTARSVNERQARSVDDG